MYQAMEKGIEKSLDLNEVGTEQGLKETPHEHRRLECLLLLGMSQKWEEPAVKRENEPPDVTCKDLNNH